MVVPLYGNNSSLNTDRGAGYPKAFGSPCLRSSIFSAKTESRFPNRFWDFFVLNSQLHGNPPRLDRRLEIVVVAHGLVGIGLGEIGNGLVEYPGPAEVARDQGRVTRAGMNAGQHPGFKKRLPCPSWQGSSTLVIFPALTAPIACAQ